MPKRPTGSLDHANAVMELAKKFFSTLGTRNMFRPKVLALVSRDDKWFAVGASVAVSPYVRPAVLYSRICSFKQSLKESVIFFKALEFAGKGKWSSSAFSKNDYQEKKDPCLNCKKVFGRLDDFIPKNAKQEEEATSASNTGTTFLAACAEYTAVNLLLFDGSESSFDQVNVVQDVLKNFHDECLYLIKNFKNIADELSQAWKEGNDDQLRKLYTERQVKETIHIFGVKPESNRRLLELAKREKCGPIVNDNDSNKK